jgi:hypothetical protein
MTTRSAFLIQTYYSGTVAAKLTVARGLYEGQAPDFIASPVVNEALERLRHCALALDGQMRAMDLGLLCGRCAARPGGGCCSAFMAGNTDSILLLINLLLGVTVQSRNNGEENCCYLGDRGCLFLVKPIFCLNYNCKHILDRTDTKNLEALYRFAAGVLSQQTRVESLLLEALPDSPPGAIHP